MRGVGGRCNDGNARVLRPRCLFPETEDAPWARAEGEQEQVTLSSQKCHTSVLQSIKQ